ncbi:PREDICTED: uncharacterized protein LOC105140654 [Populus euphratica]|uniref:Uncharacterized protein LOC105140654 n=1 Tax=Populus euphratica TaxID=75702 RepID=A0AAJ6Y7Z9_POPEU|nr:PREDICTED: uncharacterized protein LOC105140654 [Populus euphratica]
MFTNIIATGQYAWAPSAGIHHDDNVGVAEDPNVNDEQPDLEEGSGDSEEDRILNFTDDVCNMVRWVNMSRVATHATMKIEKKDNVLTFNQGKKSSGIGMQLLSRFDNMVDNMSNNSDSTSIYKDKKGCSIFEVMIELHSIEGVHIGDDFHSFVTEF